MQISFATFFRFIGGTTPIQHLACRDKPKNNFHKNSLVDKKQKKGGKWAQFSKATFKGKNGRKKIMS